MKHKVLIFIMVFMIANSYSQTYVRFLVKDCCIDTLIYKLNCEAFGNKDIQGLKPDSLGYFKLNKGESYFIGLFYTRGRSLLKIYSFNYKVKTDAQTDSIIPVYKIDEFTKNLMYDPLKYYNCLDECNGFLVDYYPDGNKRLEGKFMDGFPIGKLIFYNPDGSIQKVEKHKRKKPKYRY